ncbi:MAG: FGGY family carbohydrate kinase [Candidatus Pacebacteria bacterium]|nr:FGGY family carbohydrate kinase [Candidatus Paceibacterota bacterium]
MERKIKYIGFDGSTTALSACAYTENGEMLFVSTPTQGATTWNGQPAFDLTKLPEMFELVLLNLEKQCDGFAKKGTLCLSWRQHDMVVLGENGPLLPALSWQCNAATEETQQLKSIGAEKIVGKIEERFILPKLLWAIKKEPSTKEKIQWVFTTADYIAQILTSHGYISTSDGLSNGILKQSDKTLATRVFQKAGLEPLWFPNAIQSGQTYPYCVYEYSQIWPEIHKKLYSWKVIAGLGDNHASAVGCGLSNFGTIVVSAGSSGTVVRLACNNAETQNRAVRFEFFNRRMLLMMVADCATRFVRFAKEYGEGKSYNELDQLAPEKWTLEFTEALKLNYKDAMQTLPSLGEKVSYVRYKIASELGELVVKLKNEIVNPRGQIKKIILTGGMTKSELFVKYLKSYLDFLQLPVYMLKGDIGSKAAPYGALITAMVGNKFFPDLKTAVKTMCPLEKIN